MADTMAVNRLTERGSSPGTCPGTPLGRVRWTICAMLFVATSINYMDRQVIAILKPTLQHSIGLTDVNYGYIVDAFQSPMRLGLLASGRLVDKVGTRIGYMVIMGVWSLSAMGHARPTACGVRRCPSLPRARRIRQLSGGDQNRGRVVPAKRAFTGHRSFQLRIECGRYLGADRVPWVTLRYGWHAAFLVTSSSA